MNGLIPSKLFLPALLLCVSHFGQGQISQTQRYERQQKNSDDYFNVISLKDEGLALFRERDKYKGGNKMWELILLDTALNEKSTLDLEINDRHKMIGYEVAPGRLYFLYRTGETTRNDFELIEVGLKDKVSETGRYQIKPELDFKLTHFIKAGSNFVFGGYVNNEPAIILIRAYNETHSRNPWFLSKGY